MQRAAATIWHSTPKDSLATALLFVLLGCCCDFATIHAHAFGTERIEALSLQTALSTPFGQDGERGGGAGLAVLILATLPVPALLRYRIAGLTALMPLGLLAVASFSVEHTSARVVETLTQTLSLVSTSLATQDIHRFIGGSVTPSPGAYGLWLSGGYLAVRGLIGPKGARAQANQRS